MGNNNSQPKQARNEDDDFQKIFSMNLDMAAAAGGPRRTEDSAAARKPPRLRDPCHLCGGTGHGTSTCVILGTFLHAKLNAKVDVVDLVMRFVCEWGTIVFDDDVNCLSYAPRGDVLCIGAKGGSIQVFDVQTGEKILTLSGNLPVNDVAFSPDSKFIAACDGKDLSIQGNVRLYDTSTGEAKSKPSPRGVEKARSGA